VAIDVLDAEHDAFLELLLGRHPDVAQDRAGELGEEALDEVEPGAVLGREGEREATRRLSGEPCLGFSGDMRRVVVQDQLDRRTGRVSGIKKLEEFDKLAAAMAVLTRAWTLPVRRSIPANRLSVPWRLYS
jgi:hypothetical protein